MDINQTLVAISIYALPIILAITLHEAAHGYAARKFGDNTAWMLGRVTLNPLKHIDPIGTVLLPIACFVLTGFVIGYAKPVPVNFGRLKPGRLGMAVVALAGPAANLLLIFLSIVMLYVGLFLPSVASNFVLSIALASVSVNVMLMVFNLLPIPPLDGSRVLMAFLPPRLAYVVGKYEVYGMVAVLVLVLVLAVSGVLWLVLGPMIQFVLTVIMPLMPAVLVL